MPEAMRLAEQMYDRGRGGWTIQGILEYLERRDVKRSWQTVRRWADPVYAEHRRSENRRKERTRWGQRTDGRLGRHDHTPEFKLARMLALHNEAGLSVSAIARLMSFDYGVEFTRHMVERAITERKLPIPWGRERAPEPSDDPSISREETTRAA